MKLFAALGLSLAAWLGGWALIAALGADPTPLVPSEYRIGLTNDLCLGGRPRKRLPVSYGGLPPRSGYERDHYSFPLCLGQVDDAAHVRYQPLQEAEDKDRLEKWACEQYCQGTMDLTYARALFDNWPQQYQLTFGTWPPHAGQGAENR